jgi:ATP-dependent RNA helicase RhlB
LQVSAPQDQTGDTSDQPVSSLKFDELDLTDGLRRGIADAGFATCTPIQAESLPIALTGGDVAGQAQTGTGKTAAYLISLYQYLETRPALLPDKPGPRALILAPTRELAVQIHKDATALGTHLGYRLGLAFGGQDYDKQRDELTAGVDILIGTPGRMIDFFKQGVFGLNNIQVLVIDEADRMFDLGFIRDIRYVLRRLPERDRRQNLLFSATLSHRVLELAYEHMNEPELVRVEPDKRTVDKVRQSVYFPANDEKIPLLIMLLRQMDATRTMVFVNTKREAERLCDQLTANGIEAAAISGDVPQRKRLQMLGRFLEGSLPVLIGTDVASRGLHVPDVSHVFNYDLPQDAEDYVHRIGRTARAGAWGDAISFGCENYAISLPDIETYIGHKLPVVEIDREALAVVREALTVARPRPRKRRENDGRGGGRSGGGSRSGGGGSHRGGGSRSGPRGGGSRSGPRGDSAGGGPRSDSAGGSNQPGGTGGDRPGSASGGRSDGPAGGSGDGRRKRRQRKRPS